MPKLHKNCSGFCGKRAWDAVELGKVDGTTVRVHWTDEPYKWHTNDGAEVFLVLSGSVDMKYIKCNEEHSEILGPGDAMFFDVGDRHVAHPLKPSTILVVEREGSI